MMDIAKSETFKNFIILNEALLFLIKLSKTAVQSVPKIWKLSNQSDGPGFDSMLGLTTDHKNWYSQLSCLAFSN